MRMEGRCIFNVGVECDAAVPKCESCGWCPDVEKKRHEEAARERAARRRSTFAKRGVWEIYCDGLYRCTSCGKNAQTDEYFFCPWCGAEMERKEKRDGV